jgi:hypothetical protein
VCAPPSLIVSLYYMVTLILFFFSFLLAQWTCYFSILLYV